MNVNTSYPYPVLYQGNDDYIDSFFHADISVENSFGEVKIGLYFKLKNQDIERLIKDNKFVYSLHVECGLTSYREVFTTKEKEIEIIIPDYKLRGKINIQSFILVNDLVLNYTNNQFNNFFIGNSFQLEKGSIVAIGDGIEATLFEDEAEMLNLPTIIKIRKSLKNELLEVELNSEFIIIQLPEYEYEQYAGNANSRLKHTILTAIILPSLMYVFSKINENREDFEGYTWYQVIEKIFDENNVNLYDVGTDAFPSLKAAQLVLKKPYRFMFEEINLFNREEED